MTRSNSFLAPLRFKSYGSFFTAICWLWVGGCGYNNQPANHTQMCAAPTSAKRCPDNFHCASDNFCWKNGTDPDGGIEPDLAGTGGTGGGILPGTGGTSGTGGKGGGGTGSGGTGSGGTGVGGSAVGGGGGTIAGTGGATPPDAGMSMDMAVDAPLNCTTGQKLCGAACVAVDDPTYGCDTISCDPSGCPATTGGTSLVCQGAMCVIGTCPSGTKKCGTKCVSLTDPAYGCGATT